MARSTSGTSVTTPNYNQDREYVLSLIKPIALLFPPKQLAYYRTPRKDWMYDLTIQLNNKTEIGIWSNYLTQQGITIDPRKYDTCVAIPLDGDAYLTNEDIWGGDSMIPVPKDHL